MAHLRLKSRQQHQEEQITCCMSRGASSCMRTDVREELETRSSCSLAAHRLCRRTRSRMRVLVSAILLQRPPAP